MKRNEIILYTSTICIITWYIILYFCRYKFIYPFRFSITLFLFILPMIFILYHAFIKIKYFKQINYNKKREKEDILSALAREKDLANIIPVIIFGFGYLIQNGLLDHKVSKLIIPFLIMSLLLGTVIPYALIYNSFIHCSNEKILISEIILFSSEACALTILIACCMVTFFRV